MANGPSGTGLQQPPLLRRCDRAASASTLWRDPKGGELSVAMVKPWETVVEASHITDVQIVCRMRRKGAKDSSNRLVAGYLRSFPKDCWSLLMMIPSRVM